MNWLLIGDIIPKSVGVHEIICWTSCYVQLMDSMLPYLGLAAAAADAGYSKLGKLKILSKYLTILQDINDT